MSIETPNVLFLCTGNSARSIIAEAVLRRVSSGRCQAFSAGSYPKPEVDPHALALLEARDHDTSFARSKGWYKFFGVRSPQMDFVITLCDDAASETYPKWPGTPFLSHWSLQDPGDFVGSMEESCAVYAETYRTLKHRLSIFAGVPFERLQCPEIQRCLEKIANQNDEKVLDGIGRLIGKKRG